MGALLIVAALAQAGTAGGTTQAADAAAPKITNGSSTYVDVEGEAGYSSNPNLSLINDEGSGYGRVSLHAVHSRVSARSTTLLSAYAENVSYLTGHGSQQALSFSGRHDTALSEHARLYFDGTASYQEGGQLGTRVLDVPLVPPPTPGGIITPPILIPPTGDFLSVTGKSYSFAGHAGGSFALGPRDSISLGSGVEHVVFRNGPLRSSYTTVPVSLAYDRQLSSRTTVGARLVATDTEYDGPVSVRVITPQLTARTLLSPRISFDAGIGVSFARTKNGVVERNNTGLSAQASLCGQGEASYFCARVGVDEQNPTTAGPARTVSAGIDYTQRLDANESISFSLGATRYSSPFSVIPSQTFSDSTYAHASAAYTRNFGHRLFGGVNVAARKVTQNGPDPKTDFSASLFVRYRFGDIL